MEINNYNYLIENPDFFDFVNREFEKTGNIATMEELAEFAFGGLQNAIEAYMNSKELKE